MAAEISKFISESLFQRVMWSFFYSSNIRSYLSCSSFKSLEDCLCYEFFFLNYFSGHIYMQCPIKNCSAVGFDGTNCTPPKPKDGVSTHFGSCCSQTQVEGTAHSFI